MSTHPITIKEICELINASVPNEVADKVITGMGSLENATEDEITFVQQSYRSQMAEASKAGAVIVSKGSKASHPVLIEVDDVLSSVLKLMAHFYPEPERTSFQHPSAVIADGVKVGKETYIGAAVVIEKGSVIGDRVRIESGTFIGEDCVVGDGSWLSPGVKVLDRSELGQRVRIHSGTVLGADGFRFELVDGRLKKIPQVGKVVLEDDVEIGANVAVDRAFLDETRIGARTKIDNLVQIAHNVVIGSDCVIVSQVGIAGSVKIGRGVMIGGKTGVRDHLKIGDGAKIAGSSIVARDVKPGEELIGNPAVDAKTYARVNSFYRHFNKYWKKLRELVDEDEK